MTWKVGYLVGSLAKGSINRKLAKALVRLAPAELSMTEIGFADLPLYSYDYDADFPPAARAFKAALADPKATETLLGAGIEPETSTPEELEAFVAAETDKWARIVKTAGIEPE